MQASPRAASFDRRNLSPSYQPRWFRPESSNDSVKRHAPGLFADSGAADTSTSATSEKMAERIDELYRSARMLRVAAAHHRQGTQDEEPGRRRIGDQVEVDKPLRGGNTGSFEVD